MTVMFTKILEMSIWGSMLAGIVLLIRAVFNSAPRRLRVLLWGIVFIRLLIPFTLESRFSLVPEEIGRSSVLQGVLDDYVGSTVIHSEGTLDYDEAISGGGQPIYDGTGYYVVTGDDGFSEPGTVENKVMPKLALLWAAVAFGIVIYGGVSYGRLRKRVETAVLLFGNIYESENVDSPFVLGVVKPKIYLPFGMDEKQRDFVIAHERSHIDGKDYLWKLLGFGALAVHWFNPLVWISFGLLCRDIELSCDERVIRGLGNEERAQYGEIILSLSAREGSAGICPLAFGEIGVRERVKFVLDYKKPGFWIGAVSVAVLAAMAVCFMTASAGKTYSLSIYIPANSPEGIYFTHEELKAQNSEILVRTAEGMGDTEIYLVPAGKEAQGEGEYLTSGLSVKFPAEKDGWYKLGVRAENDTNEMVKVTLKVSKVYEIRIADSTASALKWFDYTQSPEGMDRDSSLEITLPEIPEVTFRWQPEIMEAVTEKGTLELFSGMPIWNGYFQDFTGDGVPELCATYSFGSGIIDERIIIYDYVGGASYELSDRGNYDFTLWKNETDGFLYVNKRENSTGETVDTGLLTLRDGTITVEWDGEMR